MKCFELGVLYIERGKELVFVATVLPRGMLKRQQLSALAMVENGGET